MDTNINKIRILEVLVLDYSELLSNSQVKERSQKHDNLIGWIYYDVVFHIMLVLGMYVNMKIIREIVTR